MKKLKLFATSNFEDRDEFRIEKDQRALGCIKKFLESLELDTSYTFITEDKDAHEKEIRISKLTDFCQNFKNKDYNIDVFFGKDRIILVVRTAIRNRQKIVKEILKWCEWAKPVKK
jgi:hypothetical protein